MPLGPPEDPARFEDFESCVDALSEDMSTEQAQQICGSWENRNDMSQSISRDDEQFTKHVEFKATDDDRQIASGVVMVPDKADLHGDYSRESTIREFSEGFMSGMSSGEAAGGVMHAVWPEEHVTLVENSVLDGEETIGGETYQAGTWRQSWRFDDAELWTLVRDGVLSGYSIGATDVEWSDAVPQEDRPDDVSVAADYPDDEPVRELQKGDIVEVSAVDIPAVPDAEIFSTKTHTETKFAELLGDKGEFVDEMQARGHPVGDAERLWNYLQRAADESVDIDESEEDAGLFRRVGRAAVKAFTGGESKNSEPERVATDGGTETEKESRTLSQANRERMMAAHDALESALASDVDFESNRFSDNPTTDFDVADYSGKAVSGSGDGEQKSDESAESDRGDGDKQSMSNDDDPLADAPEWAKAMQENIEENSTAVEALAEKMGTDKGDDEDESEKDADKDAADEPPEWAEKLSDEIEKNSERLDRVAKDAAGSDQVQGGAADDDDEMTQLAKLLG